MSASRADVQAKIDAALGELGKTTSSGSKIITSYGTDPANWPAGHWRNAGLDLAAARAEVGGLIDPAAPPPPPPPPPPGRVPQPEPPAVTVTRTLPAATTWAELQAALSKLQPGDSVTARGVVSPPEGVIVAKPSGMAEVIFDSACKFPGGAALRTAALWIKDVANLAIRWQGCVVTNPKQGSGIAWSAADHCTFDGYDVRQTAHDASQAFPTVGNIQGNYFRGVVRDWGLVPSLDDHSEKGTGIHGMNTADSNKPFYFRNNTIVLTTPGSRVGGSLLENGQPGTNAAYAPSGNLAWLQAVNLLGQTIQSDGSLGECKNQTAGNALNLWGVVNGIEIMWVGATLLHGHAVNDAALSNGKNVYVRAGAADHCCLNPRYAGQNPWQQKTGVVYGPGPFTPTP